MASSILIAGDLVINKKYEISNLSSAVLKLFENSDLNIVNLEAPITNSSSKILKTGPNIKAHTASTGDVLEALKIDVVTLANNHILDYDTKGLIDTLDYCKQKKIKTVGAGLNLKKASQTLFVDSTEGIIAFINFAENEWTNASENSAGANPMDIIDNLNQIQGAKRDAEFVFVIIHGGNEHNHYPSPRMVKQYRFYAENGADAVIGHHTHCVGGYEIHNDVPIFYSLGNFLFTSKKDRLESWYSGLVIEFKLQKGKKLNFKVIAVSQEKESHALSITEGEQKESILKIIHNVNKLLKSSSSLEEKWMEYIIEIEPDVIKKITPLAGITNRYIKESLFRIGLYKLLLNKEYLKQHLNYIRCEAHLDVTKEVLRQQLRKYKN